MEITVDGWRASPEDWDAVRSVPVDQLPPLTEQQREVARKLGVPEPDYARSALAGERTQEALLHKTERLARLLADRMQAAGLPGEIARAVLRTFDHRFDVELKVNDRRLPLRIDEDLVDDYFDGGSLEAEERLGRILERALIGLKQ
jgi:hypothetical protein